MSFEMTRVRIGLGAALLLGVGFTLGLGRGLQERARLLATQQQALEKLAQQKLELAARAKDMQRLERAVSAGQRASITNTKRAQLVGAAAGEPCPAPQPDQIATPDPSESAETATRTQDNIDAFDETLRVLEQGTRAKRWTDTNAAALHALIPRLVQDDVFDLHQRFAAAVNEGGLKIEVTQAPF